MSSKKPVYDFDNFTDSDLEAAIAALASDNRVKYIVVGDRFVARFHDLEVLEIPLKVTPGDIEKLVAAGEPIEQLDALLRMLGEDAKADALKARNMPEVMSLADSYFTVFTRVNEATLGE